VLLLSDSDLWLALFEFEIKVLWLALFEFEIKVLWLVLADSLAAWLADADVLAALSLKLVLCSLLVLARVDADALWLKLFTVDTDPLADSDALIDALCLLLVLARVDADAL
jgi:hypothetical protein